MLRCDHVKVPSSFTAVVAVAGTARLLPTVHRIVMRFASIPMVAPFTRMTLRSAPVPRVPVIMIDRARSPDGVTSLLGADAVDQPAPVSARTVTVYPTPLVSPSIVHDIVVVTQLRPPGLAVAR